LESVNSLPGSFDPGVEHQRRENAIRPMPLGCKNWIHFGNQEAGPRIAVILSIVETCRRLQLPICDYLAAILPGLADLPVSRVAELTPTAWAARS
jgi:transposase